VQITPEDFSKFSAVAIEDNINEKYANKVRHFHTRFQKVARLTFGAAGYSKDRPMHWILRFAQVL
jgi:hypothetical protein